MKLLLLLGMLAYLGGSSATASSSEKAEQPQDKSGGSLPGTRVTLRETWQWALPRGLLACGAAVLFATTPDPARQVDRARSRARDCAGGTSVGILSEGIGSRRGG